MIRQATIEDIPAIQEMAEVVFRETYREILSPEQMEYMMDMMYSAKSLENQFKEGVFFVCAADGSACSDTPENLAGYASVRPDGFAADGRPRYHLEKLYVMPSCQKTGLGKLLFDTVCLYVRSEVSSLKSECCCLGTRSGALLELNVNRNNPALNFYEHLGLRRARSGDFPIGRDFYMNDYIMSFDL